VGSVGDDSVWCAEDHAAGQHYEGGMMVASVVQSSFALAYQYIVRPLLTWGLMATGHAIPPMPGLDDNLWQLLLGMLGLGGLRTVEKLKGAA
jgi:hypothetical protein